MYTNGKEMPKRKLVDVLLVPYGRWEGHPTGEQEYGPEEGRAMIEYFNATAKANGKPIVIDYGHATLDYPEAPAAGWIWDLFEDLKADPPGVYGRVEWTPRAASSIKGDEYKYISPVIVTNDIDPVSGGTVPIELFNAALTNIPFMADKMVAVTASRRWESMRANQIDIKRYTIITNQGVQMDPQAILDKIMSAAGMKQGDDPNKLVDFIKKLIDFLKMAEGLEGAVPAVPQDGAEPDAMPMPEPASMQRAVANSKLFRDVCTLLECEPKDVLANVQALKNKTNSSEYVNRAEFEAVRKQLDERKADELIERYSTRIPPANRDFWRAKAVENAAETEEILKNIPETLPGEPKKAVDDAPPDGDRSFLSANARKAIDEFRAKKAA